MSTLNTVDALNFRERGAFACVHPRDQSRLACINTAFITDLRAFCHCTELDD